MPALGLGLGLAYGGSVSGLDPDAKGYIDAVVTAGATVSATQKKAINTFVKTGKSDGWYSSIKRMYLPIWASAAPNAIDMIGLTSGTFNGTVTHAAGYVQGDNSTGYFNTDTALHSVGLNDKQGMIGVLSLNDLGTDNIGCLVGSTRMLLVNGGGITSQMVLNTTTTAVLSASFTGVIVASRTSATSHTLYRRSTASGFESGAENTATEALNLPNLAPWFAGAANNNGTPLRGTVTGRQGAYFFGDGLTTAQATAYSLALKNLWETATGLTLEGAEYISTITAAGATVTATQEAAIHDFIRTGKSEGWWSSLKRLYLPIWASAAPNAVDMITRASGTFNGTVTHAAGYVQGDGTTGYFNTNIAPSAVSGLSTSTAYTFCLLKTELPSSKSIGRSRNSASQDWNMVRLSAFLFSSIMANLDGSGLLATATTLTGILSGSRVDGTRFNARRISASRTNLGSATDANFGSVPTFDYYFMAGNAAGTAGGFSTTEFGSFGFGLGLTDTQDNAFTLALKNLWETCTGLTLP